MSGTQYAHWVNIVRQTETHTGLPITPELPQQRKNFVFVNDRKKCDNIYCTNIWGMSPLICIQSFTQNCSLNSNCGKDYCRYCYDSQIIEKPPNVHLCIEQKRQEGWQFSGLIRQIYTDTSGLANRISSQHLVEIRIGRKLKIRNEVEYTPSSRSREVKISGFSAAELWEQRYFK